MIIEHAKFNRRHQLPEEPAEQFIASLYNLASNCNYGVLKGKMIRDRIVIGICDVAISADASSHGLGAVFLQQVNGKWHPVAYASRSLTETESRYAQIEKEALAATWACEKFASYIQGITIALETDHKPLVPLLSHKYLDSLPPRVLRFCLRLMRFDFVILHVPGKYLHIADALSRAPLRIGVDYTSEVEDTELYVRAVVSTIPASSARVNSYRLAQEEDATCNTLISYCRNSWLDKHSLPMYLRPYWKFQGDLSLTDNLLLYQNRIAVPEKLQMGTLKKLHCGHQGIHCSCKIFSLVAKHLLSN